MIITFKNVAGKFESDGSENYKFISEDFSNFNDAVIEFEKSFGMPFNRIEMYIDGENVGEVINFKYKYS